MILPFVGIKLIDLVVHNLLRSLSRRVRGRYRILLGMAAGVGKTYRMLQEGRQARDEGRDVVIGYLEPHDRPETAALAEGLEQVPRLRSAHGGLELEEMDVDAVIRRAPELALVDELAHTNLPEARNRKRYEDIDEILDAGIDVTSTVNVQHLESLNDSVFELTGVRVRETFPDRILDEADEVVLVDLTPEALQERLRAGKVYPPSAVEAALAELLPARQPRGAARARAARARRGRRGAAARRRCSTRSASRRSPSGSSCSSRRSRARSGSCGAPCARRSGSAPRSTRSGCGSPGSELSERGDGLARRAPPAREHPRRALHRGRGRRPRRRPSSRFVARARLDVRLRRHARRVAPDARSCAARSSRSSSASCPGSTSASSPTGRCARRSER